MKETNKKGEQFYRNWEKQREKKWQYVFLHGSIYWGLPCAICIFLLRYHFKIENMSVLKLFEIVILFMIGGLGFGLSQFKRIDHSYMGLNDEAEIRKGIQTVKDRNVWNYENLIISANVDEILTIQNQIIWFEEKEITSEKITDCFNLIYEDYQRLRKNKDFEQFMSSRQVRFQIIDNSEKESLLMEKLI